AESAGEHFSREPLRRFLFHRLSDGTHRNRLRHQPLLRLGRGPDSQQFELLGPAGHFGDDQESLPLCLFRLSLLTPASPLPIRLPWPDAEPILTLKRRRLNPAGEEWGRMGGYVGRVLAIGAVAISFAAGCGSGRSTDASSTSGPGGGSGGGRTSFGGAGPGGQDNITYGSSHGMFGRPPVGVTADE